MVARCAPKGNPAGCWAGLAMGLLVAMSAAPSAGAETAIALSTGAGTTVGYDSNPCLLRTALPYPTEETCELEGAFFWGVSAYAAGEFFFLHWLGLEIEPDVDYTGFHEDGYIIQPAVRLGLLFRLVRFFELELGAAYRWFSFDAFPDGKFHEIAPFLGLAFMSEKHELRLGYAWRKRYLVHIDEEEWEGDLKALWSWKGSKIVEFRLGIDWAHQDSHGEEADLDEVLWTVGLRVSKAWFYFEPSYAAGLMVYATQTKPLFLQAASAVVGFVPVPYVDISLFYRYEQLLGGKDRRGIETGYVRHVGGLAVLVSWGASRGGTFPEVPDDRPVVCEERTCTFTYRSKGAAEVLLAGSFTQWEENARTMEGPDGDGTWTATLTLPSGRHTYIFLRDGVPVVPENAEAFVEDDFGQKSAVVTVP